MSDFTFLALCFLLILAFYFYISSSIRLADLFKNKKSYMAAASFLLGSVVVVIFVGMLDLAFAPSNEQDNLHKGGTERKGGNPLEEKHKHEELNIDPKEIRDIIKQLEDPEERQKLVRNLNILSAKIDGMNKDNK